MTPDERLVAQFAAKLNAVTGRINRILEPIERRQRMVRPTSAEDIEREWRHPAPRQERRR